MPYFDTMETEQLACNMRAMAADVVSEGRAIQDAVG